jgi:hypothetical protein
VERFPVGRKQAGEHGYRWDGRIDGEVVPDGPYRVRVKARRGTWSDSESARAFVDTSASAGTLLSTRPAVYPMASAVADYVRVVYLRPGWKARRNAEVEYGFGFLPELEVSFTVVAPDGSTVLRRSFEDRIDAVLDWNGRGAGGAPVAEGRYVVRARVTDPAGNVSRFRVPVDVSHQQLRADITTATMAAATVTRWRPATTCFSSGCEWSPCPPIASARFPSGLSFGTDCPAGAGQSFGWAPPFEAAPVDTYRVTAVGGPTTPGAPDIGHLHDAILGPGDGSGTTSWLPADLDGQPFLPDGSLAATWGFWTNESNAYDLASFTIEYRHWVPVEG